MVGLKMERNKSNLFKKKIIGDNGDDKAAASSKKCNGLYYKNYSSACIYY